METLTSPGFVAAPYSVCRRLVVAVLSAEILLVPLLSVCDIEPVLSSTSATHSFVCPHTTWDVDDTVIVWMPTMFIRVVGIGTLAESVTRCPETVAVTADGVP